MRISDWSSDVCSSDLMGFDIVLVETVGVGQNEIDILGHADTVVLLQTAHGGDGIQMVKAGILEIADILVVNKADAPGSDKMMRGLAEMVAHAARADQWPVPVVKRSEEHTSELQSLMRISYAVFCLKKKTDKNHIEN